MSHVLHLSAHSLRELGSRAHHSTSLVYEGLIKRLDETAAIYVIVSQSIQKVKHDTRAGMLPLTVNDRRLMHEYASALLFEGIEASAPSELHYLLALRVRAIVGAAQDHYRGNHPIRNRLRKALA